MKTAADNLNFELAAEYRDRLFELKEMRRKKIIRQHENPLNW